MDSFLHPREGADSSASGPVPMSAAPVSGKLLPWVEKYRPKTVDEVSHQDEVVRTLKTSLETGNVPHLLFYGPPGTGKTSTILALARGMYGPKLMRERVMELNASDERGISVVREKVKGFASSSVGNATFQGKPVPPFKLIILDEADSMTDDAQSALRRTMGMYTRATRFCLICNYVSRIIEPLASRCAKFRFQPLGQAPMMSRITHICNAEGVTCDAESMKTLLDVADGDMRKAITYLQSCAMYNDMVISRQSVLDIAGAVPEEAMDKLMQVIRSQSFQQVREYSDNLTAEGYGVGILLAQMHKKIFDDPNLSDVKKGVLGIKFAQIDKALDDGASEELQLRRLFSECIQVIKCDDTKLARDMLTPNP